MARISENVLEKIRPGDKVYYLQWSLKKPLIEVKSIVEQVAVRHGFTPDGHLADLEDDYLIVKNQQGEIEEIDYIEITKVKYDDVLHSDL